MDQIWETVLAIIASVGGAGAIIFAVVKFCSNIITDRLSKKYEMIINTKLETYRAKLDNKNYISRARFDMEFSIYSKLTETFLSMTEATCWLFSAGFNVPPYEKEREKLKDRYDKASETIGLAQTTLLTNAAFIPKRFFSDFDEIRNLCQTQYNMYGWLGPLSKPEQEINNEKGKYKAECLSRIDEIRNKQVVLIDNLREYLDKLEVLEDK